jgi:hypothetical protein
MSLANAAAAESVIAAARQSIRVRVTSASPPLD